MTGGRSLVLVAGCAAVLTACGSSASSSAIPQTGSNQPLYDPAKVELHPSGDADFVVDAQSVNFQLDNAGLLHMTVGVTSQATATSTVTMTATLLDAAGKPIGAASGGTINVTAGTHVIVELTGNRPTGVIASVNLVIAGQPAPTPRS